MKRNICLLAVVVLLLTPVAIGCAGAAPAGPAAPGGGASVQSGGSAWQERWDKTLAAARKEGSVRMYIGMGPEVRDAIAKGFKDRYGIDVEFVSGPPGDIARKFISEREANQSLADAFNSGGGTALSLIKPKGLLSPVMPELILPEVTDPKMYVDGHMPFADKDGMVVGLVSAFMNYVVVNTDLVKENEITSFQDLLDPKWKGKMDMTDPKVPGAGVSFLAILAEDLGEAKTREYIKGLIKQEVVVSSDWRQLVEWVARGKYAVAIAPNPEQVAQFMKLGSPINAIKTKEGGMRQMVSAGLLLPTNPPHPNARTVFVNWMLSKEGQTALVKGIGQPPARVDVPTGDLSPIFFPPPGSRVRPETEEHYFLQGKMFDVAKEMFAQ